jgi:hypothetical protein
MDKWDDGNNSIKQNSYTQEMEEAAKNTKTGEVAKLRKSWFIFLAVFMTILVLGILFASIGGAVCQTIGYIFLGIDTAVIMFMLTVALLGKIFK